MSIRKNKISNEQIAEYLILNPDFFDENPEVLNSLKIVHDSGAAVSLIEKQVEYLRSNYNSTTDKLLSLLENAKNNEDLFFLTQKLLLSLIDAENIKEIITIINAGTVIQSANILAEELATLSLGTKNLK